jgi:GNAT superfamily N-acetyltransferase
VALELVEAVPTDRTTPTTYAVGKSKRDGAHMAADQTTSTRRAVMGDASAIAHVHMTSRLFTMPYLPPQKRTHQQVTEWVSKVVLPRCTAWVAVRNRDVVGYAALAGDVLEHLYLLPDARRLGIGTLLLDEARRHSPGGISLHVFQQNCDAREFYRRRGFRVVEASDGHGNMEGLPELLLRWTP